MIKLHWLDLDRYEGSDPVHIIVDRDFDWRRIQSGARASWGRDQINLYDHTVLSCAEPWFQFVYPKTRTHPRLFSIVTAESEFGTQLAESLFWCGWDTLGQFDTERGISHSHTRLGGLPRSLASTTPAQMRFIPVEPSELDLGWSLREFARGSLPVPIGPGVVQRWRSMGYSVPSLFETPHTVDDWHEAVWQVCEGHTAGSVKTLYYDQLRLTVARLLELSQSHLFGTPPEWARNTQRLVSQYRRGVQRLGGILARCDEVLGSQPLHDSD